MLRLYFPQIPLKLAWAVTIHKSQGLTFDRAMVDTKNAFALARLKGVGPKTREKYGKDILQLVREYRNKHNIQAGVLPEPKLDEGALVADKKKKPGADTRQISLAFFQQGLDIRAIADERGLAVSTIEAHLCHFIEKGTLSVGLLVDQAKREVIEKVLRSGKPMREIKDQLGKNFSYGEIKAVISHRKFKRSDPDNRDDCER